MNYIEETLKFIESDDMREHLRSWSSHLTRNKCSEIVSCAPASVEKKIPVLELIAEQTERDPERTMYEPVVLAREARLALDKRYDNPPGTVFALIEWFCGEEEYDHSLFTTFDAAVEHIKEDEKIYLDSITEDESDKVTRLDYIRYSIEKWIPGNDGKMEECFSWILNSKGEIWYFDFGERKFEPEDWDWFYCCIGNSICYLPTPFNPGDIVVADCLPFAEKRLVLIIDIKHETDCCGVRCLHFTKSRKIDEAALKHNSFLPIGDLSCFSVLYRASVYDGELTGEEVPLGVISNAIKANPQLGYEIQKYLIDLSLSASKEERVARNEGRYRKEDRYDGVDWNHLKSKFGLGN